MSPPPSPKPLSNSAGITTAVATFSNIPKATTVSKKKKVEATADPVEQFLLQEMKGKGEQRCKDADELFCSRIVPNLRRLPVKTNQMVKIKIQQLLFEAEFSEDV